MYPRPAYVPLAQLTSAGSAFSVKLNNQCCREGDFAVCATGVEYAAKELDTVLLTRRFSKMLIVLATAAMFSSGLALGQTNGGQTAVPADTREDDARAIQAVDDATKRAAQAKDANAVVDTWYGDDGSALYPNMPICTGKEALRKQWAAMLAAPGFAVDWQITKVEVSRSGDLAYTPFTYQMTMQGPDGKPIHDRGKVWPFGRNSPMEVGKAWPTSSILICRCQVLRTSSPVRSLQTCASDRSA